MNKEPLPKVGQQYHFFDDGKSGNSRHYIATVKKICRYWEMPVEVRQAWKREVKNCHWLYKHKTDYFIVADVRNYEDNVIFCRTKWGSWFSIDYPHFWMSGLLDVTGEKYKSNVEIYGEEFYTEKMNSIQGGD